MLCEGARGHGGVLGDERKAVGSRIPAGLLSERTMSARRFPLASLAWRSCSRSYYKNSNNSPRDTISQNNSVAISVCNLACAARFRANAGPKSVGMIGRPHAHPSCAGTTPTGPLQFPLEMKRALNQGLIALLDLDWGAIPIPRIPLAA